MVFIHKKLIGDKNPILKPCLLIKNVVAPWPTFFGRRKLFFLTENIFCFGKFCGFSWSKLADYLELPPLLLAPALLSGALLHVLHPLRALQVLSVKAVVHILNGKNLIRFLK